MAFLWRQMINSPRKSSRIVYDKCFSTGKGKTVKEKNNDKRVFGVKKEAFQPAVEFCRKLHQSLMAADQKYFLIF